MNNYLVVGKGEESEVHCILHRDDDEQSARNMASFLSEKFPNLSICVYETLSCEEEEGEK
ncbi:MAG: hypothetical protein FWF63_07295 [Fibromonadales bacterium]|nr:hypothetical protein [Fibromonadales bacterium]